MNRLPTPPSDAADIDPRIKSVDAECCRRLWLAVLEVALQDATGAGRCIECGHRSVAQARAINWARTRSPEHVADLAGIDPTALRRWLNARMADGAGDVVVNRRSAAARRRNASR